MVTSTDSLSTVEFERPPTMSSCLPPPLALGTSRKFIQEM
jgi:hypothetical protein